MNLRKIAISAPAMLVIAALVWFASACGEPTHDDLELATTHRTSVPPPASTAYRAVTPVSPATPSPIILRGEGSGWWWLQLPEGDWRCRPYIERQSDLQKQQERMVGLSINPQPGDWPNRLATGPYGPSLGFRGDGAMYFVFEREGYEEAFSSGLPGRTWEPHERVPVVVEDALPGTFWGVECTYVEQQFPRSSDAEIEAGP